MKILIVHNYYQNSGGEDVVFQAEAELLRQHGHSIVTYIRNNDEISHYGLFKRASLSVNTVWSKNSRHAVGEIIANEHPDVAHFHNTFPLISPAAYYACKKAGVPVVQTLHNPRFLCPAGTLFRDGHLCEECLGKTVPWPSILHSCYRRSRTQTSVVAGMLWAHRYLGTWQNQVSVFICSTRFYSMKFTEGGLPAEKLMLKPHFVLADPGVRHTSGDYALFIGRLATEKGIETLLRAWEALKGPALKIRGEGPLMPEVESLKRRRGLEIDIVPRLGRSDLMNLIKGARFLVWPSVGYYETFGLVAIEAFSCGVPIIASGFGAMAEIVAHGRTGLHFAPGDAEALAAKVKWAWDHPQEMEEMGRRARSEYEAKYTAEQNYEMLMRIYGNAMADSRQRGNKALVSDAI